jgi:LysM domain-containing protein
MSRGRHAKPSSLPSASSLAAAAPAVLVVAAAATAGAAAVPVASAGLSASGTTHADRASAHPSWVMATVQVRAGDSLSSLARRYYHHAGWWPRIWWANRDKVPNPDKLKAGETITIPVPRAPRPSTVAAARHAPQPAPRPAPARHAAPTAPAPAGAPTAAPAPAQSSGTVGTGVMSAPANVDYASGGYGVYNSAALSDPAIQGVVINVGWNAAEPSRGSYNWTQLDKEASAWAAKGKNVAIVVRFASEVERSGTCADGFLPAWEASRIPTYCDSDVPDIVPDYFDSTFQSDFGAFVTALGDHLKSASYKGNISYIRIGVGLAAEGFDLMQKGKNPDVSTDVAYITKHWGYTPAKWEAWQEQMLSSYKAAMPSGIPILYPIVKQDTDPATGNPVDLDVAEWWLSQGGGLSQDNLPPGGYGNPGYADFGTISGYMKAHEPNAYVQFQSENGLSSSGVSQSIATAESYGARSIEWYENEAVNSAFNSIFNLAKGG